MARHNPIVPRHPNPFGLLRRANASPARTVQRNALWQGLERLEPRTMLSNSLMVTAPSTTDALAILLCPTASPAQADTLDDATILSASDAPFYLPPQRRLDQLGQFLTNPTAGDPLRIALDFLGNHASDLGLSADDVSRAVVTDQYTDQPSGITHIYLRQTYQGLQVMNADLSINISAQGEVINVGSSFVQGLGEPAADWPRLLVSAPQAYSSLDHALGLGLTSAPKEISNTSPTFDSATVLSASGASLEPVPANLVYVPSADGLDLAWRLNVQSTDKAHWYDAYINADNAQPIYASDWVQHASYNVFAFPTEAPNSGNRSIVTDPHDPIASPFGWHDTDGIAGAEFTDTQGNNVFAQEDQDANDTGGLRPSGGDGLNFDFPINFAQDPTTYQAASITNLFYWTNLLHDIHYRYGFTEAAGNFQFNNYGRGGADNDPLMADAQDTFNVSNGIMLTPPDGQSPRMQVSIYTFTTPRRDGVLDNGIVIHEYGHGVTRRLTGGPANSNSLDALQSRGMAEGWSDWYSLMLTQVASDAKLDAYSAGTYVIGQPSNGPGLRRHPYSFDMAVNGLTYGDFNGGLPNNESHNAGEIWCSALWDLNWFLIDKYGYSSDLINGNAGNNLALQLVMDGLKLQGANPSFLAGRDAILTADLALSGGANKAEIWTAFARRGMGFSASDGGNANSFTVTEAFDLPPLGAISGNVFRDDDADGVRNGSEPGLAGWTLFRDLNNNGVLDQAVSTMTFSSTDIPKAIADRATSYSNLDVLGLSGVVTDVNVTLSVTHPHDGELYLTLLSPGNTPVILSNYQGGSGDNFTGTTFDDEAATPIAAGTAPFSGTFKPHFNLSLLDNINPNGTWKLRMDDSTSGNAGTLLNWSLEISYFATEPSTVTDVNGNYSFANLADGTQHIREVLQAGFTRTAPASGVHDAVISGGQPVVGRNFGNHSTNFSVTPGAPDLLADSDTGLSSADNLTKLDNSTPGNTLQFSVPGTIPGALVELYADGVQVGSATATGAATTIATTGVFDLIDSSHQITARQTEPGKSQSPLSPGLAMNVDTQGPTVTVNQHVIQTDPSSGPNIYFTAVFSEAVADFLASDVTLNGTAGANNVLIGGGTSTYDFLANGMTISGTVIATIAAFVATDAAGNGNAASTSADNVVTYIASTPEIAVSGLSQNIVDGDSTPSTGDDTDFGSVTQNAAPISRTFTVTNSGSATLTLGTVAVPTGFSLGADALLTSLAPGASDTFSVQLNTTTAGTFVGDISFSNNDGDENPFNFRITGTVNSLVNTKPTITSITDSPDPVIQGATLTLTANGVSDPDAGDTVDVVEFYRDTNGNGVLNVGVDALLGTDISGGDGWSLAVNSASLPLGSNRYFARAFDGVLWSSTVSATGIVNALPTIASIDATPGTIFKGDNVTINASGVGDSAPGTVSAVEFYRDVNGNGVIDVGPGGDSSLGSDTSSSGGWIKVTSTSAFPVGNVTLMARTKDNNAGYSPTFSTTVFIDAKPTIGSLTDSPDPLIPGNALTLTAGSVVDSDGAVVLAEFYRDVNNNSLIDVGTDELLGSDASSVGGWVAVIPGAITAAFPVGSARYLARVQDNLGAWSATRSSAGSVSNPPVVGSISAAPDPVNKGSNLTITATGVSDPDAGQTITSVTFYRDSNNSGSWESTDSAIATDSTPGDGWNWTGSTSSFPTGTVRLFARAKDNLALFSTTAATTTVLVNALPVVTVTTSPLAYALGSAATIIASSATVTDANSPDFNNGSLTVQFTGGTGQADDRLAIRNQGVGAGQIGISGSNVTYGGAIIGTWSGGTDGSTPLAIALNNLATPGATQALARNITYLSLALPGTASAAGARTISFTVNDGDGGISLPSIRTISVI